MQFNNAESIYHGRKHSMKDQTRDLNVDGHIITAVRDNISQAITLV
jgi:hypothetical protein